MLKRIKKFYNEYPYLTIIIGGVLVNIVGAFFEYLVDKEFQPEKALPTVFMVGCFCLIEKCKRR